MKKKLLMLTLAACLLFLMPTTKADAASVTELKEGQNYKIDLNGDGRKETFKYTTLETSSKSILKLYINGKHVYSHSESYGWPGKVCLADFNKKDKYKEICFEFNSDSDCLEIMKILRYQNKKLKAVASRRTSNSEFSGRVTIANAQKGDGTVTVRIDTPYYETSLGCYFVDIQYQIKKGTLVKTSPTIYPVSSNWKKSPYTLSKQVTFTTTRTGTKKAFTLAKGQVVYLNKVSCKKEGTTISIQVRTRSGKLGWLKLKNFNFYKEAYAWG
ncbi:hypothetical protein lbkm_1265 [Lachnospiraceae bacterium KM106-2]|nr:hypothetical protein lbkm_1265 [Lachnospiraceae bacterium KM106-2]